MLKVNRKIATEAGAESILRASYQLSAPLGVPTLILDPADFDPSAFSITALFNKPIADRVMNKVRRLLYRHYGPMNQQVTAFLRNDGHFRMRVTDILESAIKGNKLVAHSFRQNRLFNVVICPRTRDTAALLLKHGLRLPEDKIPEMPGYNAQWNFIKIWHEFAHGLMGKSEPQADQMTGLIHQHVFADPQPLIAFTDFRAAQTIINHEHTEKISVHGWPLVDTLDQVLKTEVAKTWDETVKQAKQPAPSNLQIADVQFVGGSLKNISKIAFSEPDLLMLGMMADHMAFRGNVENENQLRIARRFAIAAQRLSIGSPAYAATAPKPNL